MQVIRLNYLAAFVVGALGVSTAGAQNVVFTNSTNASATPQGPYSIQLKAGQPVSVAPNGDIRAQCELDSSTGRCVGIPAGGGGAAPINANAPTNVSMSTQFADASPDAGLQITAGTPFSVNASAASALACVRSVSPAVSAWSGVVAPGDASAQLALGSVGTYTFDFKCLNDAGATSASSLIVQAIQGQVIQPPPPTGSSCAGVNDGYFPPRGLASIGELTFTQLWQIGSGQPVGGALTKIEMAGGQYRSYSFDFSMLNAPTGLVQMQMNADTSNTGGRPGADYRFLAISECPNDLRQSVDGSPDPMLKRGCRVYATEGPFIYLNFGAPIADPAFCNLDPSKKYYMNVTFDAPFDGFSSTTPCNSTRPLSETCGFRVQVQF